jgi:AraC-like DNA-binding protein
MEKLLCELYDIHEQRSFEEIIRVLNGTQSGDTIHFNNNILKGHLITNKADKGLAIAKWKCSPFQTVYIRKPAAAEGQEKKFLLLYFLTPTSFYVSQRKRIQIRGSRNNILLSNETSLEFCLSPKQQFYLFEISFSPSWLIEQLKDADYSIKQILDEYISSNRQTILIEPFTLEEYKLLHELEVCLLIDKAENFFVRSRVYNLLVSYFAKIIKRNEAPIIQTSVQYDQLIEAEMLIMQNIKRPPSIDFVARSVNMSVASLIRKFKIIHGKSIYEYYISKKMELARKIVIELRIPIKQIAEIMGYNQASAFIESFTKQYGYTPGQLKQLCKSFSFF